MGVGGRQVGCLSEADSVGQKGDPMQIANKLIAHPLAPSVLQTPGKNASLLGMKLFLACPSGCGTALNKSYMYMKIVAYAHISSNLRCYQLQRASLFYEPLRKEKKKKPR